MQTTYKIRINGVRNSTITLTNRTQVNALMEDLTEEAIDFTFTSFEVEKKADSLPTLPKLDSDTLPTLPKLPSPDRKRNNGVSV